MISVIIPVFNRRQLVGRAIASVMAQTCRDLEVIVVDDASTDGTWEYLQEQAAVCAASASPPLRLLRHEENRGVSAARNTALTAAGGQWLALLDSDDEWKPRKLERQLEALEASRLQVCHSDEIWIRNGVRVNPHKHHRKYGGRIFDHSVVMCAMSPSSIIIDRTVLEDIGDFDESLPACEDYDLFLRMTCRYEVDFVEEPLIVKYGGHDDQLSRQHAAMDRFRVQALDRVLTECGSWLSLEERQLARTVLESKATIVRDGAARRGNDDLAAAMQAYIGVWRRDRGVHS